MDRAHERVRTLLTCRSTFGLDGGTATPTALIERAATLGYAHVGICDPLHVTGAVEAFTAARAWGVRASIGATLPVALPDGGAVEIVLIAASRAGYATLCELLTAAHAHEARSVPWRVLLVHTRDLICLTGGRRGLPTHYLTRREPTALGERLRELRGAFGDALHMQLFHDRLRWDDRRARVLRRCAAEWRLPTVAAPDVRYADPSEYRLHDALTCARLGIDVDTPHPERPQNDAQALLPPAEYAERLPYPEAWANADRIAERCAFDLLPERLAPPRAHLPEGVDAQTHLERRCLIALAERYPHERRAAARGRLEEELATIRALALADFFLVAAEVSDYCRARGIHAAGRGSAAASICCYLLGITRVDPLAHDLLFERFLHTGRRTMPDVDLDVSSARRDEVLAWIEERFGASTEAMVANKITYRLPLAIQDLGRALGIPAEQRDRLTRTLGRDHRHLPPRRAREASAAFDEALGDAPAKEVLQALLSQMATRHTRHLAPHAGGVVLSREPLTHYAPLARSSGGIRLLQIDKDDAEALGLIKLDVLGLRMLSALERAREEVWRSEGIWIDLDALPDDPSVWDLIEEGRTLGLFQIESPSQVNVARTMRSRTLRDLAHQIALIRPGPIQSGTVHPYLARRRGREATTYHHPGLEPILRKSHGVILFQEDVLRICVHFAGMDWAEADRFRKRVSTARDDAEIAFERARFITGAARTQRASVEEAEAVFDALHAFQGYGFAESHAWAFAQHAYASAWLRHHHPAAFMAAILEEAPGMWSAATKRQEARAWGVPFLPIDANRSGLHYRTERTSQGQVGVRIPLTAVEGIGHGFARAFVEERLQSGAYADLADARTRVAGAESVWEALVRAGAFDAFGGRREALYAVRAQTPQPGATPTLRAPDAIPAFAPLTTATAFAWEHTMSGLSSRTLHPLDFLRGELRALGAAALIELRRAPHGSRRRTAGWVISRQKPPTAGGFAFYVLEDGPLRAQAIIAPDLWQRRYAALRDARVLIVDAVVMDTGPQLSLRAEDVIPLALERGVG